MKLGPVEQAAFDEAPIAYAPVPGANSPSHQQLAAGGSSGKNLGRGPDLSTNPLFRLGGSSTMAARPTQRS